MTTPFVSGPLTKQDNGRWAIGEDELTSGDLIRLAVNMRGGRCWFHGRIEHSHGEYYFLWVDLNGHEGKRIKLKEGQLAARQ